MCQTLRKKFVITPLLLIPLVFGAQRTWGQEYPHGDERGYNENLKVPPGRATQDMTTALNPYYDARSEGIQLEYRVVDLHTVNNSVMDFKTSLVANGPSYWRHDVYSDFYDYWWDGYSGEVYVQSQGERRGGHAVLLIGWDDGKAAYLCKNSWGEREGPNGDGTFWIAYTGHAHDLGFQMSNFSLVPCGNGVCEEDEDCTTCPTDCIGGSSGTCNACFKGVCNGECHPTKEGPDCADCSRYCCGDGTCEGEEDGYNCEVDCGLPPECGDGSCDPGENGCTCFEDCGAPPVSEDICDNGEDDDCDGLVDCDDADCEEDSACEDCLPDDAECTEDSECCSNKCAGKKCR